MDRRDDPPPPSPPPSNDVSAAQALLDLHPGRAPSIRLEDADLRTTPPPDPAPRTRPTMTLTPPTEHDTSPKDATVAARSIRDESVAPTHSRRSSFSREFLTPDSRAGSPYPTPRRRRTSTRSKSPNPPDPTRANAAGRKDYPGLEPDDLALVLRFPQRQRSKNARYVRASASPSAHVPIHTAQLSFIGNNTLRLVPPGRGCLTCERQKIPCFILDRDSVQHTNHSRCFSCGNTACSFTRGGGPPKDLPPRNAAEEARLARAMIVATIPPPPGMLPPSNFAGTSSRHVSRSVTPSVSVRSAAYTEVTTPPEDIAESPATSVVSLAAPKPVQTPSISALEEDRGCRRDRRRSFGGAQDRSDGDASFRPPCSPTLARRYSPRLASRDGSLFHSDSGYDPSHQPSPLVNRNHPVYAASPVRRTEWRSDPWNPPQTAWLRRQTPQSPTTQRFNRSPSPEAPWDRRSNRHAGAYPDEPYRPPPSPPSPSPSRPRLSSTHHPHKLPSTGYPQVNIRLPPLHVTLASLRWPTREDERRPIPPPPAWFTESLWPSTRGGEGTRSVSD